MIHQVHVFLYLHCGEPAVRTLALPCTDIKGQGPRWGLGVSNCLTDPVTSTTQDSAHEGSPGGQITMLLVSAVVHCSERRR